MKFKLKLNEKKWDYIVSKEKADKFRESINDGDLQGVKDSIINIYEEIFNKGYIDGDDFDSYTEEVRDIDLDEDEVDYQLSLLYDLCDNLNIFIPTPGMNEQLKSETDEIKKQEIQGKIDKAEDNNNPWKMPSLYKELDELNEEVLELKDVVKDSYDHFAKDLGKTPSIFDILNDITNNYDGYSDIQDTPELTEKWYQTIANELTRQGLEFTMDESLNEGKADIYADIEDEYIRDLNKAEEHEIVTFTVAKDTEAEMEFETFEEAKRFALEKGFDEVYVSSFGFEGPEGYENSDYIEYDEKILGLDKHIIDESLNEDTVKQGNSWVNKGKEGTHGEFKTKKEADSQRKAMFAQGYKAESLKEGVYKGDSNFLNAIAYLDENKDAFGYCCSIMKEKMSLPVGKGFNTQDAYNNFVRTVRDTLGNDVTFSTMYQDDKEEYRKSLHDSLNKENSKPLNEEDGLPFPEVEPEKEISIDEIEDLEFKVKDSMEKLHKGVEDKIVKGKEYLKSLKKVFKELDDIIIPGINESFKEEEGKEEFEEQEDILYDDDFNLDESKILEALNSFSPDISSLPENFIQNNSTIVSEQNGIVSGKENIQESANVISMNADPSVEHDDVCDIELV